MLDQRWTLTLSCFGEAFARARRAQSYFVSPRPRVVGTALQAQPAQALIALQCDVLIRTTPFVYDALSPYNASSVHDALFRAVGCSFRITLFLYEALSPLRTMLFLCTMLFSVQRDAHDSSSSFPVQCFFCTVVLSVQHSFCVMLFLCNAFLHNPVLRFGLSKGLSFPQYAPSPEGGLDLALLFAGVAAVYVLHAALVFPHAECACDLPKCFETPWAVNQRFALRQALEHGLLCPRVEEGCFAVYYLQTAPTPLDVAILIPSIALYFPYPQLMVWFMSCHNLDDRASSGTVEPKLASDLCHTPFLLEFRFYGA